MTNDKALPARRTPRIVLLEDERALSSLLEHCIHEWFERIDLVEFESGDEAWQELSRRASDLLILDWKHPGLTGYQILQRLASDHATFPVLLTSELFEEHVQLFSDQGLKLRFLPKPFHIWEFWAALNELVGPSDYPEMQSLLRTKVETYSWAGINVANG